MTEASAKKRHVIHRIRAFFGVFLKKPLLAAFLLGMTSGFPLTLITGVMTVWLSEYGVSKTTVGLFLLATLPYSLKILWSPILDRASLGPWTRILGRRRGWLILVMGLMVTCVWFMSLCSPEHDLVMIAKLSFAVGFLSASQDIIIDAYRIEITDKEELGHSAGMYQWGYRIANLIAGAGIFTLAHYFGWSVGIGLLPLLALPGLAAILWIGEPVVEADAFLVKERESHRGLSPYLEWLYEAVILPFKEFVLRRNWYWILLFIVLVKFGDVMAAMMTGRFLVDLHFTLLEMAFANKTVGALAAGFGGAAGTYVWWRLDPFKALFVSVFFMMVTNLGFVWLDYMGHNDAALAVTVGLENFATGVGGTVMIAYFGSLCNLSFTATQYALLSMLSSLARGVFGSFSGMVADAVSWSQFFLISTALALPGLIVLMILWKKDIRSADLENVTGSADM